MKNSIIVSVFHLFIAFFFLLVWVNKGGTSLVNLMLCLWFVILTFYSLFIGLICAVVKSKKNQ